MVIERVANYLKKQYENASEADKKTVDAVIKNLPSLQVGLDVNFGFTK